MNQLSATASALLARYFPELKSEDSLSHAIPLLARLTTNRADAERLLLDYDLNVQPSLLIKNLTAICASFVKEGLLKENQIVNPYYYRLPMIIGEFPRHTRVINHSIQQFNVLIEAYHRDPATHLDPQQLNELFLKLIQDLEQHGAYCCPESLAELVTMLRGWSAITINNDELTSGTEEAQKPVKQQRKKNTAPLELPLRANKASSPKIFNQQNSYPINQAGRLAARSHKLLVNAFGLKFGGHFDALATYAPTLIPIMDFYHGLCRELSLRIELNLQESGRELAFKIALLNTLSTLGMVIETKEADSDLSSRYINPFCNQPQVFITPSRIKEVFTGFLAREQLTLKQDEIEIISEHLNHTMLRMHFNPALSLGIGANDDGTVSLSNDAGSYAFEFTREHAGWAARFEQLSLHRQGPAQAKMNAAKGVGYELSAATFLEFDKRSQLQEAEYEETIYNALIDNMVTDLFPHPDFFYNKELAQFSKRHFIIQDDQGINQLHSYRVQSKTGIFQANDKLVPRHRRAGTIDVQPLPRDQASASLASRNSSQNNPLAAEQYEYARTMLGGVRGDLVYNPIAPDSFILDQINGQLIKNADGSILPLLGLIPKNFDKYFQQNNELCASFVIRMMHSSRMMEHSPTLREAINHIKVNFLPSTEDLPKLPEALRSSTYLLAKHQTLCSQLAAAHEQLPYEQCEHAFVSLIKNIIYDLRCMGSQDARFLNYHQYLITQPELLRTVSREHIEKIIRGLEINPPTDCGTRYAEAINYLKQITASFYPEPSAETAQQIRAEALKSLPLLSQHASIKNYFAELKNTKAVNLSRRQSPGMLYGALKHGKATLSRISDLYKMHQDNFVSGYRNAEGWMVTEPLEGDAYLDVAIKLAAMLSALLQHDQNPLKQIYAPITKAYEYSNNWLEKNREASLQRKIALGTVYASLGLVAGSIEGCAKFTAYTLNMLVLSPTQRLIKRLIGATNTAHVITENPLFLPAAPANEPGFRVLIAKEIQNAILLEAKRKNPTTLIHTLRVLLSQIITQTHPSITVEEKEFIAEQLLSESILTHNEWAEFYAPWEDNSGLASLLTQHQEVINSDFIAIAYRCFLSIQQPKITKQLKELYHLNSTQSAALNDLARFFIKSKQQNELLSLFSDKGTLTTRIELKYKHLQTLYNKVILAFNSDKIRQMIHEQREKAFTQGGWPSLQISELLSTHPYAVKQDFHQFYQNMKRLNKMIDEARLELEKSSPEEAIEINEELRLIESAIVQIKAEQSMYLNALYEAVDEQKLIPSGLYHETENEKILSIKDKAQKKWGAFAKRELQHQLLDKEQTQQIMQYLELYFPAPQNTLQDLDINNKEQINVFYTTIKELVSRVKNDPELPENLAKMLEDYLNVSMNALVNSTLDQLDYNSLANPLLQYDALGAWLLELNKNKEEFRSLLAQQTEQTFLDDTLIRQIFIINSVEAQLQLRIPEQWNAQKSDEQGKDLTIRKTGLQRTIRTYLQHNQAVKNDGSTDSSLRRSLRPLLNRNYPTFFYATQRVEKKMAEDLRRPTARGQRLP